MDTEQAAQDPNMPPVEEVAEVIEPTETAEQGQPTDTAPVEDDSKSDFVDPKDIAERTQAKINKLTAKNYASQREAERLKQEIESLKAQTPVTPTTNADAPKLEDFDFDEAAHTAALIEHKVNESLAKANQQQQQSQAEQTAKAVQEEYNGKVAEYMKQAPDFAESIQSLNDFVFPPDVFDAIMQADNGPEIAHYLSKNLDVASDIINAGPIMGVMKLGTLTTQFKAAETKPVTSAAPEPITPVGSGGVSTKAPEDMSMDEIYNS